MIDHDALVKAARHFLTEEGTRCRASLSCDDLATAVQMAGDRPTSVYACDKCMAAGDLADWREMPQAQLVRLLASEEERR
jgi:hypothetical protein